MDRSSNARGAGAQEQIHHFMFLSLILFISFSLSVVLFLLCCFLLYYFFLFASFTVSDHAIRKPREIKKGLKEEEEYRVYKDNYLIDECSYCVRRRACPPP
jgi:hypothetical protein